MARMMRGTCSRGCCGRGINGTNPRPREHREWRADMEAGEWGIDKRYPFPNHPNTNG